MTARPDRWVSPDGTPIEEEDRGLVYDLQTLVDRRRVLGLFGGVGAAALLAACSSGSTGTAASSPSADGASASSGSSSSASSSAEATGDLVEVPDETGGPYPGDGSNGINVLDDSGIVRQDIRSSFGTSTTTAAGVPMTLRLTVRDVSTGKILEGASVYAWHCDAEGRYSLYSSGLESENYLRGVQPVDDSGTATFTTVFPGCYRGRYPHIHFEVYGSVEDATSSGPIVKTSQIALPQEACEAVYATAGYETSAPNLAGTSLTGDNVFGEDGGIHQLATITGDAASGYTATLTVGV